MASSETAAGIEAAAGDLYLDYVARPYAPLADWRGKLRSEALLDASAASAPGLLELKSALQAALGRDRIVYGVKERAGRRYWELYVYNYERRPELSPRALAAALPKGWSFPAPPPLGHAMYSFELDEAALARREVDALHVYTITEGARVTSNSFLWKGGRIEPENVYLPMPLDGAGARRLFDKFLRERVLRGTGLRPQQVFPPEFAAECRSACWAFKPREGRLPQAPNSLYVSTLSVAGLLAFLERFGYEELANFARARRARFDHLLFDVGYDFDPRRAFTKSGFYGLF